MQLKRFLALGACALSLFATPLTLIAEEFLVCIPPSNQLNEFSASLSHTLRALEEGTDSQVQLRVEELNEPNAYALRELNTILVSTALYPLIRSSAEEAFVVAHELGHLRSSSAASLQPLVHPLETHEELAADRYALIKLTSLSLDAGAGIKLLNRLKSMSNSPNPTISLQQTQRLQALRREAGQIAPATALN